MDIFFYEKNINIHTCARVCVCMCVCIRTESMTLGNSASCVCK